MKNNLIIIISATAVLALGSCAGSGGVQQGMRQDYYSQGFYYGNRFYDPQFYSFVPRGPRVIIIDNRTNEPVASPNRRQIREARDADVRKQPRNDTPTRQRRTVREDRDVDTRSREQVTPRRTQRSEPVVSPQRNQGSQPRTAPAPRQQNRNAEGRSRRGGN